MTAVVTLSLAAAPADAAFRAVMMAGNYLTNRETFDDRLDLSRDALAATFATWPNWSRGMNGNIDELPGNATAAQFLNAIAPYEANGARAMAAGDTFVLFYFGHGDTRMVQGNERVPAISRNDEFLHFPNASIVTDNELKTHFASFAPGVHKLFINISCHSGGFWNGTEMGAAGDLEQVANTGLIASSREDQNTFAGFIPNPLIRWWEPTLLASLIAAQRPAMNRNDLTISQLFFATRQSGFTPIATARYGGETESPDYWDVPATGAYDAEFFYNDSSLANSLIFTPEPGSLLLLGLGGLLLKRRRARSL
jgi:hypothetical protein